MKQFYLILTDNCNLHCSHCIRNKKNNNGEMNLQFALKCIDDMSELWSDTVCVLSGGEPTLHSNFDEILEYSLKKFNRVSINSNGTSKYWTRKDCVHFDDRLTIQISIDGTENIHNSIRGEGAFVNAINTIRKLLTGGNDVVVSTTVSQKNNDSMYELAKKLIELGVKKWSIQKEMPFGEAVDSSEKDYSVNEWNSLCDKIIDFVDDKICLYTRKLYDFSLLEQLTDEQIKEYSKYAITNCGTAKHKIYIHPNMEVYGCTCLEDYPLGNLKCNTLQEIIESELYLKLSECKLLKDSPCNSL